MAEANALTLTEAAARIRAGELTSAELVDACLGRLEAIDSEIGAFAHVAANSARADARRLDAQPATGPLHGVPIALKDLIFTADMDTEANCEAFKGFRSGVDATVVVRLRAAGAVIIGKTNTHELAFGVSCPASRNPWNVERMTGGSSGGNAAALAARMVPGALGTDTGGSVRIPSSYCGTTAIKTTAGLVPRDGVHLISTTYDTVGPMARTAADCALLLEVIAGCSPLDPYSRAMALDGDVDVSAVRLGVPTDAFFSGIEMDPRVMGVMEGAIDQLTGIVGEVKSVEVPNSGEHFDVGAMIVFAEAAHLLRDIRERCPDRIGTEPREIMELGAAILAPDFAAACDARVRLERRYEEIFTDHDVDVIIAPVTPNHVLPHGVEELDGMPLIPATTQFCFPVNGAGLPSIALPGGLASDGLPVGFQLVGPAGSDVRLARIGERYQQATDWHELAPAL